MEAKISPCSLTKEEMTELIQGYLEPNEYIHSWEIDYKGDLRIIIYVKEGE